MNDYFDRGGFLERLNALRLAANLSKGDFCKKIGVRNVFSVYAEPKEGQTGRKVKAPSAETLTRISAEFYASVDWLLFGDLKNKGNGHNVLPFTRPNGRTVSPETQELVKRAVAVLEGKDDKLARLMTQAIRLLSEEQARGERQKPPMPGEGGGQ